MWLRTSCTMNFEIEFPTPFILMLRMRSGAQQWVASEKFLLTPSVPVFEFTDIYGNLYQRLVAPPGNFSIATEAEVMTADLADEAPGAPFIEIEYLPDAVLGYLLPSRYCESDRFNQMALEITEGELPGYDQVKAIESWLRRTLRYDGGGTDIPISAVEVNQQQHGVCRDFAHLGIALCRSISIPARLVVGYLHDLEPMDLHAWFEAYVGGRWYTFDAAGTSTRGGYVAIGYGRDAADVAVFNQFGPSVYPDPMDITVERIDDQYA